MKSCLVKNDLNWNPIMRLTESKLQIEVRKIVIFGAGKIGRSFISRLFGYIGYQVIIFLLLFSNISYGQQANAINPDGKRVFRAAVVKVNITPDDSQNLLGYGPSKINSHT